MGKDETKTGTLEAVDKLIKKIFFDEQIYIDFSQEAIVDRGMDPYGNYMGNMVMGWKTTMRITRIIPREKLVKANAFGLDLRNKIPDALMRRCDHHEMIRDLTSADTIIRYNLQIEDMGTMHNELLKESWNFYKDEFDMLANDMLEENNE